MPTPAPIGAIIRALIELGFDSSTTLAAILRAMGWDATVSSLVALEILKRPREPAVPLSPSLQAKGVPEVKPSPPLPPQLTPHSFEPPARTEPRLAETKPEQKGETPRPFKPRARVLPSTLTTLANPRPKKPTWLADSKPLLLPDPRRAVPLYAKPIEPLFQPLITRAILTRLAAVPASIGEVDVAGLVKTIAQGQSLTALPRRTVSTLGKGLELLLDSGGGMEPFANDVAGLVEDVTRSVGRDRLKIWMFRFCPSGGVVDPETSAITPYRLPPAGTPILVVTDLGIRERPSAISGDDWLRFAVDLRSRGNPLTVLMPRSPARIPITLRRALAPIPWDRRTSARLTAPSRPAAPTDEGVIRLGRLASIAGRIDPQFLRALRLYLASDLGVEAEADLWFSSVIQTAAITGLVLRAEHQRRFQQELIEAGTDLLTEAWEILFRLRTDRPWSEREQVGYCTWLLAQEELTYLGLQGLDQNGPNRAAAERLLKQILITLTTSTESERERDAVIWIQAAHTRLPPAVTALKPMQHLLLGAALRQADTLLPKDVAKAARHSSTAYLAPRHRPATSTIWLRLVEGGLEAALDYLPQGHRIEALALEPLPLALDWHEAGTPQQSYCQLKPEQRVYVPLAVNEVEITTPGGGRFRLSRVPDIPLMINIPPPPEVFIDRKQELEALLEACLKTEPEAENRPLHVFIAYAQKDEVVRAELVKALRPLQQKRLIKIHHDSCARADEIFSTHIEEMRQADVVLVLLGPDFIESEIGRHQIEISLRQSEDGSALVIPIIGRSCDWMQTSLSKLNALPKDSRPIMANEDATARAVVWMEIGGELERAFRQRRRFLKSHHKLVTTGPHLVALVGPDGIGKFTLARRVSHEPKVRERYQDGILWLGEDGSGYPRQWLHDYCEAVNEPAPFGDHDVVDPKRFQALFDDRQALFVVDHRTASDILPTLIAEAGSACTVLVLSESALLLPAGRLSRLGLAPLGSEAVKIAAEAFEMPSDAPPELINFAAGNPLLLRLAAAGAKVVGSTLLSERANEALTGNYIAQGNEPQQRRAAALVAGLWSSPYTGGLTRPQQLALRRLVAANPNGARSSRSDIAGNAVDLAGLIRLGLVEDLGLEIRLHPLVRSTVGQIDPGTAEVVAMLTELDWPDTSQRRRVEIGQRLDALGDPRCGVGVGAAGTPEIDWRAVAGGEVVIQDWQHLGKQVQRFHIARYPVTVTQYRAFLTASDGWDDPNWWKKDGFERDRDGKSVDVGHFGNHPAVRVSWFDAMAYCSWLSHRVGFPVRLPDEWEWQQAAATTSEDARNGFVWDSPWQTGEFGTYSIPAVGMYPASASHDDVLDTLGSIGEWCLNKYYKPHEIDSRTNYFDARVICGSEQIPALSRRWLTQRHRHGAAPDYRSNDVGFRVAVFVPIFRY